MAALTKRAEQADGTKESACETSLPEEIRRREDRKAKISEAIAVIEARHKEKLALEKEAYEAKVAKRKERRERGEARWRQGAQSSLRIGVGESPIQLHRPAKPDYESKRSSRRLESFRENLGELAAI